jgi:hypothetical protein
MKLNRFFSSVLSLSLVFGLLVSSIPSVFASDPGTIRVLNNKIEWNYKVFEDDVELVLEVPTGFMLENAKYNSDHCKDVVYEGNVLKLNCAWAKQLVKNLSLEADIKAMEADKLSGDVIWSFNSQNYDNASGIFGFIYEAAEGEVEALEDGTVLAETGDSTGVFQNPTVMILLGLMVLLLLAWAVYFRKK